MSLYDIVIEAKGKRIKTIEEGPNTEAAKQNIRNHWSNWYGQKISIISIKRR